MTERIISQNLPINRERSTEQFKNLNDVIEAMHDQLLKNSWEFESCPSCEQGYYRKRQSQVNSCSSYDCLGEYEFLQVSGRRNQNIKLVDVKKKFNEVFSENGFRSYSPVSVKETIGNSVFIGNVGQIFDNHIFNDQPVIDSVPVTVLQPAIRLQKKDQIDNIDGFSTSFINVGSEQLLAGVEEHLSTIEKWMDFMSGVGLFMGDFALKPKLERASWGEIGQVEAYTLKFNYKGLELGVGNYTIIPRRDGSSISQSEGTFGLERIMWAINKNSRFYDVIGPFAYAIRKEDMLMDAYRTTTLMVGSGVYPGTDEHGSKLRNLVQKYGGLINEFNPDLVAFYHDWWSRFGSFPNDAISTVEVLRTEFNRQRNVHLQSILKDKGVQIGSRNITKSTDLFVADLLSREYDILREGLNKK